MNRRFLFTTVVVIFVYCAIEGVSFLGLAALSRWRNVHFEPAPVELTKEQKDYLAEMLEKYEGASRLGTHDATLGWSPPRGGSSHGGLYQWNSQGIRAERDYSPQLQEDSLRISTFGDSFTLGSDVSNDETWEEQLTVMDPSIEVLNFGVGAYGLDQAFLRYLHDGSQFENDIVMIGFMSENIFRNVNVFRPFYTTLYSTNLMGKPRFLLRDGDIVLQENLTRTVEDFRNLLEQDERMLIELGRNDFHYQQKYYAGRFDFLPSVRLGKIFINRISRRLVDPVLTPDGFYNPRSEAYRVTDRIFDEFYRAVLAKGALPIILIYPDPLDMIGFSQSQTVRYAPLMSGFDQKGYRYIDLMVALAESDPRVPPEEFTVEPWGHYSRLGNEIVAGYLLDYLRRNGLDVRSGVRASVIEERKRLDLPPAG